ncbi:hypothetical protein [Agrobacterium tumefaciens]|uniref:hypothetical protein n=1 Tax=Agrobacterium tumefaciens TaxID=358 RepID=UPI001BADB51B|nr:hypothetical protein [Agrobacterium tumefaciens]
MRFVLANQIPSPSYPKPRRIATGASDTNIAGLSEKSGASARTKSVTGFCGCDMKAAQTKTARSPEENRAVSKPVNSGEVLMGCQKCTSMREKRQSLQVRAT